MLSFVCSIGNVPLAAVLWNGGISFGGVLAFIFADLIILPILNIYRKYYGRRMAAFLLVTFYVTMAAAGLIVDLLFKALGIEPTGAAPRARSPDAGVSSNYTTVLNIIFLVARRRPGRALLPQGRRARDAPDDEHADGRASHAHSPRALAGLALRQAAVRVRPARAQEREQLEPVARAGRGRGRRPAPPGSSRGAWTSTRPYGSEMKLEP